MPHTPLVKVSTANLRRTGHEQRKLPAREYHLASPKTLAIWNIIGDAPPPFHHINSGFPLEIVFDIVMPVFGLVLLGFCAGRFRMFDEAAIRGLSLFVFNFAIPVMMFRTIATIELPTTINWGFLFSYYLGAAAVFVVAMTAGKLVFARAVDEQTILGVGAAHSNLVLLGIPIVLTTYGEQAALPLFMIIVFSNPLLFPTVTSIIEISRGREQGLRHVPMRVGRALISSPPVTALAMGLIFNWFSIPLAGPINNIASLLGSAGPPCALFVTGAALTQYKLAGNASEAGMMVVLKLAIHPAIVWVLATYVFDVPELWMQVGVIVAALPAGVLAFLFAQRYSISVAPATSAVFASTALSAFSLTLLLFLFDVR